MRKWERGVKLFGNPPQEITRGVFVLVDTMLLLINRQKADRYTAPLDCEALLAAMQHKCNTSKNPAELLYNTHPKHRPTSAGPPPTATSAAPPPPTSAVSQPLPPTASTSAVSQPAGSSARTPHKRRNADQNNGPSPKRTREESSDSDLFDSSVEPDSLIPGPVHHPRHERPVRRRKLFGIDQSNCVVNRTRAASTPTELYQEPEQANWGRNGTEAIAVDAFLPTACPLHRRMSTCTNCYCQLTDLVNNTTARQALCVLCGRYKSQKVSIINTSS